MRASRHTLIVTQGGWFLG